VKVKRTLASFCGIPETTVIKTKLSFLLLQSRYHRCSEKRTIASLSVAIWIPHVIEQFILADILCLQILDAVEPRANGVECGNVLKEEKRLVEKICILQTHTKI
jgi:hypothetical protein